MRITRCTLAPYRLPLRQAWVSARGGFVVREGWLIKMVSDTGLLGYGDCAPLPQAGTESREMAATGLSGWAAKLSGVSVAEALASIKADTTGMPAARCGLETALLDLQAQHAGVSLARWLNPHSSSVVKINAVLGSLDKQVVDRALTAAAEGYSVLKLKVGLVASHREIALLHELASALPVGVSLRLDANCAWDEKEAQTFLGALSDLPIESVEDPLINPDAQRWSRLQANVPFPLAADASLQILGVDVVLDQSLVRRVVLKPMVVGGLAVALALARRAGKANVECIVTTTVDSAVGVTAALHLASAVANDFSHGLGTSAWFAEDIGQAPLVAGAVMYPGEAPGLGCFLTVG